MTAAKQKSDELEPVRILVIEDDEDIAAALLSILQSVGTYEIQHCHTGTEAIDALKNKIYQVILCDIVLPEIDGIAVIRAAREDSQNKNTPVCMISGFVNTKTVYDLRGLGVERILNKPFEADQVGLSLQLLLQSRQNRDFYDPRLIDVFRKALSTYLGYHFANVVIRGPFHRWTGKLTETVAIVSISFSGKSLQGVLTLDLNQEFLQALALKIQLPGEAATKLALDIAQDIGREMGNQVCGLVKNELAGLGASVKIGLPSLVLGPDAHIRYSSLSPVLTLVGDVDGYQVPLEFCLEINSLNCFDAPSKTESFVGGMLFDQIKGSKS